MSRNGKCSETVPGGHSWHRSGMSTQGQTLPRRALITGGSRGIGAAAAVALAEQGCSIAVTGRSAEGLDRIVELALQAGAPHASALPADVMDTDAVGALPGDAESALGGPINILVHAAGISESRAVDKLTLDAWNRSFAINVTPAFLLGAAVAPSMREAGWGRIVLIGSLLSRRGMAGTAAYTASKHAVLGLMRVLSEELVGHGVTSNAILPGWVDTEMVREQAQLVASKTGATVQQVLGDFTRDQPIGRMVKPDEIGAMVAFLCSDAGAAISGQGIHVDGGSVQG